MFFVSIEILILEENFLWDKKCEIKNKFDSNFNACKTKDTPMDKNILYCWDYEVDKLIKHFVLKTFCKPANKLYPVVIIAMFSKTCQNSLFVVWLS